VQSAVCVAHLNTIMCSLWSAPNAVGGVRVLPSGRRREERGEREQGGEERSEGGVSSGWWDCSKRKGGMSGRDGRGGEESILSEHVFAGVFQS
jgi:hypothetical protein